MFEPNMFEPNMFITQLTIYLKTNLKCVKYGLNCLEI